MKRIFITILAAGLILPAAAQGLSLNEEHRLNLDVLRMLETYEATVGLRNNDDAATFSALFPDENLMIYNDLLGISDVPELSVAEYVTRMRRSANSPIITLRNVRKNGIEDAGDKWIVSLLFDKEVRYTNRCGAILSSRGYYGTDYNMEVRISRDKNTGVCTIESLTGNINSNQPPLGEDFVILEYRDPRDRKVTNNGEPIVFNTFDQAFLASPYNLKFYDDDANMKVNNPDPACNKLNLSYHPLRWRLKAHYDLSLGDYYNLGELPSGMNATSSGSEFGLDFGYIFPSKGKFKVGLFFGVGMASSNLTLTQSNGSFKSYDTDIDGDNYTRVSEVSNVEEKYKLQNLLVPLYFDFEYRFHSYVSAFFRLGAKAYVNMGSKSDGISGSIATYGVYSQYGDLVITEDYMNGFGTHDLSGIPFSSEATFPTASMDAFAGLGVRSKIYGPLSVEVGVNYQFGLTDAMNVNWDTSGNFVGVHGDNLHLVDLSSQLAQMKRSGLRLNIGLILKF